ACMIGKAHDVVGVGDIDPARVVAGIERNAEGAVEVAGEYHVFGRLRGIVGAAQDANAARMGFRDKDIAVRGDADDAGTAQVRGERCDLETWRDLRRGGGRLGDAA